MAKCLVPSQNASILDQEITLVGALMSVVGFLWPEASVPGQHGSIWDPTSTQLLAVGFLEECAVVKSTHSSSKPVHIMVVDD